ncbi:MAG: hypothetical protein B6D63_01680 [Candidatus Latescibacteria bacterium 4484_7]|nr:MAG: hypothetical protein B6D63_01680 [Candidatus Latescibacteria bacterium 4484_7]
MTGLAGITASLVMFAGDMVLYGGFYGGAASHELTRLTMSEVSVVRLMIGGALGPIGAILYAVGFPP